MYLGNQPALSYTSFAKQDFTVTATTNYTLDHSVSNENEIALFINFIRQEPTTSYTCSGNQLTLTEATSVGDDMYCVFIGKAVQTVTPADNTITTAMVQSSAISTAKIADDAVTKDKLSAHNYPAFLATLSTNQSIANNTVTKVQFDTEVFDTDNYYDNSTNYRFTPLVAGKYFVTLQVGFANLTNVTHRIVLEIHKNGSTYARVGDLAANSDSSADPNLTISAIVEMNGSTDYLEGAIYQDTGGAVNTFASDTFNRFQAYRIGD